LRDDVSAGGGAAGTVVRLERALAQRARTELAAGRQAAVAVVLSPEAPERTSVLLIERTVRPDDPWSGQMAFPGGRVDEADGDGWAAALREAREEVGLDLAAARPLGVSDDVRAIAGGRPLDMVITPYVFVLRGPHDGVALTLQRGEVADVLWAPLEELASGRRDGVKHHVRPGTGEAIKLPTYEVGGKVVWGLTHLMLRNLLNILRRFDEARERQRA
jgi:8-oxo-dGTP pyrophosphatase MutT (NUDIX family)